MPLKVAVVGSGPAGLYCADRLLRDAQGCEIDVIEKLPCPYGLVRSGVAPDHQGTKGVTRVFDRLFQRPELRFWGHVEVGRDVALDDLLADYDAVVLAVGAPQDRRLDIPGEDLPGVYGSGAFVGWYNGLPPHAALPVDLSPVRHAVLIGAGNVAIDVARVLAKTPAEMARSDLDSAVEAAIAGAPLQTISIVARRGAADVRFTPTELAELRTLARAQPQVLQADLPAAAETPVLKTLSAFAATPPQGKPIAIGFRFNLRPVRIVGTGHVEAVEFADAAGRPLRLPADLVVSCIGYGAVGCGALASSNGIIANEDGRVGDRLYVVGWAKRGPTGTIPTNRAESHAVAQRLVKEVAPGERPGRRGLEARLAAQGARPVSWSAWQAIDAREVARAAPGRVRAKFRTAEEMLAARPPPVTLAG